MFFLKREWNKSVSECFSGQKVDNARVCTVSLISHPSLFWSRQKPSFPLFSLKLDLCKLDILTEIDFVVVVVAFMQTLEIFEVFLYFTCFLNVQKVLQNSFGGGAVQEIFAIVRWWQMLTELEKSILICNSIVEKKKRKKGPFQFLLKDILNKLWLLGKNRVLWRLSYNQLSRGHSRLIQQLSSLRSHFHKAFKCTLNFNHIHKSCMTLMLSTCLSALLKCGWRNGFMSAGSRKKEPWL